MIRHHRLAAAAAIAIGIALMPWCAAQAGAAASVTRFGTTAAQACYRAAEDKFDLRAGLALCEQALAEEPLRPRDRAATIVNRGIIKLVMHDTAGALADYNAATALMPELGDAYVNRGLLYMQQGYKDELAIAELTKGLALGSRDEAAAHYGRAFAYEAVGRLTEAYHDFQRAAQLKPKWPAPQRELARFVVRKAP